MYEARGPEALRPRLTTGLPLKKRGRVNPSRFMFAIVSTERHRVSHKGVRLLSLAISMLRPARRQHDALFLSGRSVPRNSLHDLAHRIRVRAFSAAIRVRAHREVVRRRREILDHIARHTDAIHLNHLRE